MPYLLDSGILLRLTDQRDAKHDEVQSSVRNLIGRGEDLLITTQNVAEFCSVATRPQVNNGLGLAPNEALQLLQQEIEPICSIIAELDSTYGELKHLIAKYAVVGKQVHDARLVALMISWQIENILTLNDRDFRRYQPEGITIVTPASLVTPGP